MQVSNRPATVWRKLDPQWLILLCALPLALAAYHARGGSLAEGEVIYVRFTLITADETAAMCAAESPIFGRSCQYRATSEPFASQPPRPGTLQPFGTVRGPMYLVEDLFADPALAARVEREPAQGKDVRKLKRFEALCGLRLLGRAPAVHVRFGRTAKWAKVEGLWVGALDGRCKVFG